MKIGFYHAGGASWFGLWWKRIDAGYKHRIAVCYKGRQGYHKLISFG